MWQSKGAGNVLPFQFLLIAVEIGRRLLPLHRSSDRVCSIGEAKQEREIMSATEISSNRSWNVSMTGGMGQYV
jgi:hypothetical protein